MPTLTIDRIQGDEELVFDGTNSFVGGMVSNTRANLLKPDQCAELINVDLDQTGAAVTRRGTLQIGSTISANNRIQGLFYYDTASTEQLLAVCNTGFYTSTGGAWTGPVAGYTAASATLQINSAQLISNTYFVDGSGEMMRWNGTTLAASSTWAGLTDAPPSGLKYIVEHQGRIAASGSSNREYVYLSDIFDEEYPAANILEVGTGNGDPITGLFSWIDSLLLVFKERSIQMANTADAAPANWTLEKIHDSIGCVSHRTIKQVGQDVFFLAPDGVRSVRRTLQQDQQEVSIPISFPINNIIQRINSSAWNTSNAVFWNNRYMVSVPLDNATTPNYTLVYHTVNGSWSGYWIGWTPTVFEISAFSGVLRLNFGDTVGKVHKWLDYVPIASEVATDFQDSGTAIATTIKSKSFTYEEPLNPKFGSYAELEFFQSTATVNIYAILNRGSNMVFATSVNTATSSGFTLPFTFPLVIPDNGINMYQDDLRRFGEFRELQFQIESSSGKIFLRAMAMAANINTLKTS